MEKKVYYESVPTDILRESLRPADVEQLAEKGYTVARIASEYKCRTYDVALLMRERAYAIAYDRGRDKYYTSVEERHKRRKETKQ